MFDLETGNMRGNSASEKKQFLERAAEPGSTGSTSKANQERQHDLVLVETYKMAAAQYGERSEQASEAFAPIFERFWPQVYYRAMNKIGAVYAEDLASETLKTVWERLNGNEIITNLAGLVRHSFEREYATLLEKLFQGRKLSRHQNLAAGEGEASRVKGAMIVSLNAPTGNDSDEMELIHTLNDPDANVEEAAARREMIRTLHTMINQMPAHYREPLVCQWLMGMKIKEVSEKLDMTVDQVKHNTRRGMDWLCKRMPSQNTADWL